MTNGRISLWDGMREMFTKQPEYVVKRLGVVVFHGTRSECERFEAWANAEYRTNEYVTVGWK